MAIPYRPQLASIVPASERRAAPRLKTATYGTIANITRFTKNKRALIVDMSRRGLKVETELLASPGDALRIDLPDSTLLAEAVHCERTLGKTVIGLKVFYTVNTNRSKEALSRKVGYRSMVA